MTLIVAGAVLLLLGFPMLWAQLNVFDSQGFADRTAASLDREAVQDRLAERLSAQIVENRPQLADAEPLIAGAAEEVIDSSEFQGIFSNAVRELHRLVFEEDRNEAALVLTDAVARIIGLLEVAAPEIAEAIPPDVRAGVIQISESDGTQLARIADRVRFFAIVLPVLGVAAIAGGLWLAADRRAAVLRVGLALAVVAGLILLALFIGREVITGNVENPENAPAVGAIWTAFTDPLRIWMWVVGIGGLGAAAAAAWIEDRRASAIVAGAGRLRQRIRPSSSAAPSPRVEEDRPEAGKRRG